MHRVALAGHELAEGAQVGLHAVEVIGFGFRVFG